MKKLSLFVQGIFIYLFIALPAYAQAAPGASVNPCLSAVGFTKTLCELGLNPSKTIGNLIFFFVLLAIVIALLYLVYGGIKWITSRGEKDQVEAARNHIIAAIVGLIVVFLAIFILSIILAAFGIKFEDLKIPTII